jgi:hypothetical protein
MNIGRCVIIFLAVALTSVFPAYETTGEQQLYPCTKENAYQAIDEKDFSLLICSFGSPPEKKKGGWWNANGISFHKILKTEGKSKQEFLFQVDEFDNAVDYYYKDKTLNIISYADALPGFKLKPFLKEVITLSGSDSKRAYTVMIDAKKYTNDDIAAALSLLNMSEGNYTAQYREKHGNYPLSEALYKLRDYAVQNPEYIAKKLTRLRSTWWRDGEMAETLFEIEDQVKIFKKIKPKSN